MKIKRVYLDLENYIKPNKVLVIYGPRQVGKTTLLNDFLSDCKMKYKLDNGDNIQTRNILGSSDFKLLKEYVEGYELLVIDEAQRIKGIGQGLKILVDQVPDLKIIVTGSSSFELSGQVGEPLTGRKTTLLLFPVSQLEMLNHYNEFELKNINENFLIFGSYPEIITLKTVEEKVSLLNEIAHSYLLKDILELERIKSSQILLNLLRLLAFQIGSEVSLSELAKQLTIDVKTVGRYIDLLEKSYILYSLRGFSKNLRKEMVKKAKYYFYDLGIRNAIIANFNPLNIRNDKGELWENFLVIERLKKQHYHKISANNYFWRTWDKKEIDWIEEREGKLFAFEFKYKNVKLKAPADFINAYSESSFEVIHSENYLDFIS